MSTVMTFLTPVYHVWHREELQCQHKLRSPFHVVIHQFIRAMPKWQNLATSINGECYMKVCLIKDILTNTQFFAVYHHSMPSIMEHLLLVLFAKSDRPQLRAPCNISGNKRYKKELAAIDSLQAEF